MSGWDLSQTSPAIQPRFSKFLSWLIGTGITRTFRSGIKVARRWNVLAERLRFDKKRNVYVCPRANCLPPQVGSMTTELSFTSRALVTAARAQSSRNALRT